MKAAIHRDELNSEQLSWLSVKPMLLSVLGKDIDAKTEMYRQLSEGQQALYLFYSYHNHTNTLAEFYWFSAYYIIEYGVWDEMIKAVRYFDHPELAVTLELTRNLIETKLRTGGEWKMATPQDLDTDPAFCANAQRIYDRYRALTPHMIKRMNDWVFERQEEYFVFEKDTESV